MFWLAILAGIAALIALGAVVLHMMFAKAAKADRPASQARRAPADAPLAKAAADLDLAEGESSLTGMPEGLEAFAARIALIRAARDSLDVQYYVWQADVSGHLLLKELVDAVQRGVRLRLLLDDLGSPDLDPQIAALNAMKGAEVRLFNPFVLRKLRMVNFVLDFRRLNRRMHNKALIADGAACILGGRNVGDEYFDGGDDFHFIDFDVVMAGACVAEVAADFDRYWASESAVPVSAVLSTDPDARDDALKHLADKTIRAHDNDQPAALRAQDAADNPAARFAAGQGLAHRAQVSLVSDDPVKATGRAKRRHLLASRLARLMAMPQQSADFISAYFVPGRRGLRSLRAMAARGVRVRVLTNGQQSTDVALVHCGHARYRRKLLRAGVEVFELKAGLGQPQPRKSRRRRMLQSSSGNSLHAKTFVIDRKQVFVGSFNMDQRSVFLNTEIGVLIDSPELAAEVEAALDHDLRDNAYRLFLKKDGTHGALRWAEALPEGGEQIHVTEPGTTLFNRTILRLAGRLPIEWLL